MRLNLSLLEGTAHGRIWRRGRELHRDGLVRRIARRDPEEDGSDGYDAIVRVSKTEPEYEVELVIDFNESAVAVLEEWSAREDGDSVCAHTVASALAVRDALARQRRDAGDDMDRLGATCSTPTTTRSAAGAETTGSATTSPSTTALRARP